MNIELQDFQKQIKELSQGTILKNMDNSQLWLKAITRFAHKLPASLVAKSLRCLFKSNSSEFYQTCKYLAKIPRKGQIAHSFNLRSLLENNLPIDYDFGDYLKDM